MSESPTTTDSDVPSNRFTDSRGREWVVELDFAKLRVLRTELDVDLGDKKNLGRTWAELLLDDDLFASVLWVAVRDRAGALSEDDFLAGLCGDVLDAAQDALEGAVLLFTRPLARGVVREAISAVRIGYRRTMAEAQSEMRRLMEAASSRASRALGKRPSASPGSSAPGTTAGASATRTRRSKPGGRKSTSD